MSSIMKRWNSSIDFQVQVKGKSLQEYRYSMGDYKEYYYNVYYVMVYLCCYVR